MFEPECKRTETKHEPIRIGLLGATFDTGNLGVSALAESSIKVILNRWPEAEVTLLDSSGVIGERRQKIGGKDICIRELPIRFCKNIFLENHFFILCLYALLFKVFRWEKFKSFCIRRNASLRSMIQIDMVADVAGGDSFSDIYGMHRFILGFLRNWLVLLYGKNLIMLPQTYGPFKRRVARAMAKYILKKARLVYSRDRAGIDYVNELLSKSAKNSKVRFTPDVAFVLDVRKPEHLTIEPSVNIRAQNSIVIGLNISGLLFNGGYTQDNMFGLKIDYRELIYEIIEMLLKNERAIILLIPHVFPPVWYEVESDPDACRKVYEQLRKVFPDRIFIVKGEYNQGEIKHIIGLCDFFIGSRMHSCIAAMSQAIPTVGLAYSRKFQGVFASVGAEQFVVDMRRDRSGHILTVIAEALEEKGVTAMHLRDAVPGLQKQILNLFEDIS